MTLESTRDRLDELLSYVNDQRTWPRTEDELVLAILDLSHQLERFAQENSELESAAEDCLSAVQFLKDGFRGSALVQLGEALSVLNEVV